MRAAVSDDQFAFLVDSVYETVFIVNTPRPPTRHVAAKLFRMADAVVWIAVDVLDELIEPISNRYYF
jgi:hypothetical protein